MCTLGRQRSASDPVELALQAAGTLLRLLAPYVKICLLPMDRWAGKSMWDAMRDTMWDTMNPLW